MKPRLDVGPATPDATAVDLTLLRDGWRCQHPGCHRLLSPAEENCARLGLDTGAADLATACPNHLDALTTTAGPTLGSRLSEAAIPVLLRTLGARIPAAHRLRAALRTLNIEALEHWQFDAIRHALADEPVLLCAPPGPQRDVVWQTVALLEDPPTVVTGWPDPRPPLPITAASMRSGRPDHRALELAARHIVRALTCEPDWIDHDRLGRDDRDALRAIRAQRLIVLDAHHADPRGDAHWWPYQCLENAHRALGRPPLLAISDPLDERARARTLHALGTPRAHVVSAPAEPPANTTLARLPAAGPDHANRLAAILAAQTTAPARSLIVTPTGRAAWHVAQLLGESAALYETPRRLAESRPELGARLVDHRAYSPLRTVVATEDVVDELPRIPGLQVVCCLAPPSSPERLLRLTHRTDPDAASATVAVFAGGSRDCRAARDRAEAHVAANRDLTSLAAAEWLAGRYERIDAVYAWASDQGTCAREGLDALLAAPAATLTRRTRIARRLLAGPAPRRQALEVCCEYCDPLADRLLRGNPHPPLRSRPASRRRSAPTTNPAASSTLTHDAHS
jgi:hypothetical protein